MSWKQKIQESLEKNSKILFASLRDDEEASLALEAEDSEFVRFNKGKARQATSVEQAQVTLVLQTKKKITTVSFPLTGVLDEDRKRSLLYLGKARQELDILPDNPFYVPMAETGTSHHDQKAEHPRADFMVNKVAQTLTPQDDFIGYLASGPLMKAFVNSKGTYHWHSSDLYFVVYSLFHGKQGQAKAVTDDIGGNEWNETAWQTSLNESRHFLQQLQRPSRTIQRGGYRVYLAPAAVSELKSIMSWGGFSQGAYKQGQSPLRMLASGEAQFSPKLSIIENFNLGLYPRFNSIGELAPHQIPLVENGKLKNLLTSAKTAAEFGIKANGADRGESTSTVEFKPGTLKRSEIFDRLGTGLYLSNLHYVNWSDHKTARMTGMTRYACFWVENGEIVSPIQDMRFDVSLYDVFGTGLIDLTDFQTVSLNNSTYMARGFGGSKLPGMLIDDFKFTL
jgi:predicted Zn-dependent protease